MLRPLQKSHAVIRRNEWREKREAAEVHSTVPERREQLRLSPCGARDGDAAIGPGLREVQGLGAVSEHRRESLMGVESALIGFANVRDEVGLDASRLGDERCEAKEQLVVGYGLKGDSFGLHAFNIGSARRASRKATQPT